jgi:hypothetical protein
MRRRTRIARIAAVALALGAVATPAAFAQQDLRSPDTRDAALAAVNTQDLRSPDTRDAALAAVNTQDLRSPDTRDAAIGHFAPAQVPVSSHPAPVARSSDDSPWPTAGIGLLVLTAVGCAGALIVVLRRRTGGLVATVAAGTRDWRRGAGL